MDAMQEFLRREARRALEAWRVAEQFSDEFSSPQWMEFAIYRREAAKRRYLSIWRMLKQREAQETHEQTLL